MNWFLGRPPAPLPCRCVTLSPVCRRFRRLATSPELLPSSMDVSITSCSQLAQRTASLAGWLARHAAAGRLQRLSLSLEQIWDIRGPISEEEEEQSKQAERQLLAGLAAAFDGAAAPGAALRLRVELCLPVTLSDSWMAALRGLSALHVSGRICSEVTAPLDCLRALQQLDFVFDPFGSRSVGFPIAPLRLPTSLTSLALRNDKSFNLPPAVSEGAQ